MISLTLRQLHYFDALARIGHFGRAAEACAVTQPALSMQIHELEAQLGVALFERGRKRIVLTEAGRAIAGKAARILMDAQDLIDVARHRNKVLCGTLRFGVIPTVGPYLLPALLPKLSEAFPDLELHVRETQTSVLLAELSDGKLDVVFLALPIAIPELESRDLIEDKFLLAVPSDYQGKGRVVVTEDFLRHQRLLLLEEGHCFRDQALIFCGLQQSSALNTMGASTFATIVRMVANGLGITFLPEMAVSTEIRSKEIRVLRLAAPEPKRTLGLVWRKTSARKQDFEVLGKLIAKLKI
ncbi:MAG TPA: hydrogen peroxide-inducible genes activator [Xanthobacteraceae bacterium]|nr:hydrogen peroxide-inducible genes activator [Xanthobacteraceae bacterium]